jgi:hypothetical protein
MHLLVLAPRSCRYGVFGRLIETCSKGLQPKPTDPRLFLNTNAPLSAVICGVQGSGKVRRFLIFPQTSFLILRLISIPPISALLACSPSPSLPPSRSLPKSHSVSILLESMLLQDPRVGSLKRPSRLPSSISASLGRPLNPARRRSSLIAPTRSVLSFP